MAECAWLEQANGKSVVGADDSAGEYWSWSTKEKQVSTGC